MEDGRWKIAGNIEHPTSNEARIYFTGANRDRGERKEFPTTDFNAKTRRGQRRKDFLDTDFTDLTRTNGEQIQ
jgi:hypothetical protein